MPGSISPVEWVNLQYSLNSQGYLISPCSSNISAMASSEAFSGTVTCTVSSDRPKASTSWAHSQAP